MTLLLFFLGIGKKSVYKALKDFPDRFLDLTALSDLDIDQGNICKQESHFSFV